MSLHWNQRNIEEDNEQIVSVRWLTNILQSQLVSTIFYADWATKYLSLPRITLEQIQTAFPDVSNLSLLKSGGQKIVYSFEQSSQKFVLKILRSSTSESSNPDEAESAQSDEVFERAKREVNIIEICASPYFPSLGPIGLSQFRIENQNLVAFSEQFIDGELLEAILVHRNLSNPELTQLALNLCNAVEILWSHRKIHRDINPKNIIRRHDSRIFVLLDPGIAYGIDENSLTEPGLVWHTRGYLAPELADPATKREADFRSDFFLIGTVLYLAATGIHPFIVGKGDDRPTVIRRILNANPPDPIMLRPDLSPEINQAIIRMLAKRRHGRFRTFDQLRSMLEI